MKSKPQLLYISPSLSSFVRLDIKLLSTQYHVRVLQDRWSKASNVPWLIIKQFLQLIILLPRTSAVIVSFAGYWSFLPVVLGKIFRRNVFVILHGTDVCDFPEIEYGNLRIATMRWFNRISFKYATQLLPVSKSLIFTENTYFFNPDQPLHFGVRAAFPSLMPHYTVVHNGIDLDFWAGDEGVEKTSGSFITVASAKQLKRKGVDLIIEAAALLPESHFTIIGAECPKDLKVTSNVDFVGKLPQSALVEHYKKAQFYLQLSSFEGFGLSLCEAMLCGCTPIGSDVNYIPTIIGDTGYVLARRDMDALIELLEKAMMDHPIATWNEAARQRIIANYSAKKRQEELYNILAGN